MKDRPNEWAAPNHKSIIRISSPCGSSRHSRTIKLPPQAAPLLCARRDRMVHNPRHK